MARIALITDSSACLPPALSERNGIRVLSIRIHLPSGDLDDGVPGASERVYDALRRGEPVKSSAPTPLDYLGAIEETGAQHVVIVTPATEFTTMYRSASLAGDLAPGRVTVVDSRTAAAAQGLVVLEAADAAREGASIDAVVSAAEDASRRADLVASLENIEFVRRSGRVPPAALGLAQWLGVRPVFRLSHGAVERLGIPRSEPSALRRIHREWASGGGPEAARCAVFHAARWERARELGAMLGGEALTSEFSPSMGIHTGPGLVGVAWLRPTD